MNIFMLFIYYSLCICPLGHCNDDLLTRILQQYRQQRIAEIVAAQPKAKFGSVKEISAIDYVDEVSKAGEGIWSFTQNFYYIMINN